MRNETSLVQTAGRAARHLNGECVLFADVMTDSIKRLVELTDYRRGIQEKYNREHGIVPQTVSRSEQGQLKLYAEDDEESFRVAEDEAGYGLEERIARLEAEMKEAASHLEFERAALIRDEIRQMRGEYGKAGDNIRRDELGMSFLVGWHAVFRDICPSYSWPSFDGDLDIGFNS